jgi:hypothetical protein
LITLLISLDHSKIQAQLATQLAKINDAKNSQNELWMFFDSGASRSVISTTSPVRTHLQAISPAYGSCSIGDGTPLNYLEKGNVTDNLEITVVKDLKYDLFSSVNAAKQGLTSIMLIEPFRGRVLQISGMGASVAVESSDRCLDGSHGDSR